MQRLAAHRTFLLSPASLSGKRAERLLREDAGGETALELRAGGLTIADVFGRTSSLYSCRAGGRSASVWDSLMLRAVAAGNELACVPVGPGGTI